MGTLVFSWENLVEGWAMMVASMVEMMRIFMMMVTEVDYWQGGDSLVFYYPAWLVFPTSLE